MDDEPLGNINTQLSVQVGSSVTGTIEEEGDVDFFAVTLQAGVTYQIDLEGSRTAQGTLIDPFLTGVFDSNGIQVAQQDDDDGVSTNSRIIFTPSETGTFFIGASHFDNFSLVDTGSYTLFVEEEALSTRPDPIELRSIPETGNVAVDVLTFFQGYGNGVDTTNLTFSIPGPDAVFTAELRLDDDDVTDLAVPISSAGEAFFRDGLAQVEEFANVLFQEVEEDGEFFGTIRIFGSNFNSGNTIGLAGLPSQSPAGSDIAIFEPRIGSTGGLLQFVVLHELGHALGLDHADIEEFPEFPAEFAGAEFTLMVPSFSSAFFPNATRPDFYPTTYGYLDILALRQIYGAPNTPDTDDVYTFNVREEYWETIFDTGGTDTLQIVGGAEAVRIDLSPDLSAFGGSFIDVGTTINFFNSRGTFEGSRDETVFISPETVIENIITSDGDDTVVGNAANNRIEGGNGADKLSGADGADRVLGAVGSDELFGGQGNDTVIGGTGSDRAGGGDGNDILFAGAGDEGNDLVVGGNGSDIVAGGRGNDTIVGGNYIGSGLSFAVSSTAAATGRDTLFGGEGDDVLITGSFNDNDNNRVVNGDEIVDSNGNSIAYGGKGNDSVFGGNGNDQLGGGTGDDTVYGGAGNDTIYGGRNDTASIIRNDQLQGGEGNDLIFASGGVDSVSGGAGDDTLFGGNQNDTVSGGDGNDTLFGGSGDDTIFGDADNDDIFGGNGQDLVDGGSGDDTIRPSGGDDTLTGGSGADLFIFANDHGEDIIMDFATTDDTLNLAATVTDFTSLADVTTASSNVNQGGTAGLLIDTGGGNSIFIAGLTVDDLSSTTIIFE